ncbi:transcription factor subunit Med10 of mediator complex-domain-containing protein [Lipomyces tetrasporus]|uniref:Mediator of RNA polymerase II transcription subunit 10 n=1 Tax=Lipomyces tetrasporus TaxID=54092 RepID=A0AAD7VQH8_9ASCO|nr:transcription factor subunit Med10 of mediator complex-domain-containing protein [Lipomyces tetrasporus]KAJ8097901.1 transcription factor subunit Med10 of mediator complex-domain-containing protein [Lipomyces tetrasporus]
MSSTDPTAQIPAPPALQAQEDRLRQVIETLIELAIGVHDYESVAQSKDAVIARVNLLTSQLSELASTAKESVSDVLVPREIVQYIEDGRNPNVYTREFVELLVKQNQFVNGKMRAMRDFRDVLAEQIRETYPELSNEVDVVLQNTGPSYPPILTEETKAEEQNSEGKL